MNSTLNVPSQGTNLWSVSDIIKLVITSISIFDFVVFVVLFTSFMFIVTYKSKKKVEKLISCVIIVFFLSMKSLYIPIFLSTIPYFNINIKENTLIMGILTWINVIISGVTLIFAIMTLLSKNATYEELILAGDRDINIIMPIYNENFESLWKTINSVMELDYPLSKIVLYLAFDEGVPLTQNAVAGKVLENNSDAYVQLVEKLNISKYDRRPRINVILEGVLVCICRFDHGGKKSAQYGAFKEIEKDNVKKMYKLYDSLLFLIDSDIILKRDSLLQFCYFMKKYKKSGLTGLISCITSNNMSFLTFYQDIEYLTGQIFWRNVESYFYSTTCLPGAFTILKYSFFKKVSKRYFESTVYKDNTDYHRFYLGEDRYLTHLLMESEPWQLSFCQNARCKTDAPNSMSSLMKQRRRWYLGHLSNDVWMMSSYELWKQYPLLSLFNLLNNSRNTSIYIFLIYFILLLDKEASVMSWLGFVIIPMILNWLFVGIYIFKIKRKMNFLFYISMLFVQPIFNMIYMYYTIYTIKQRSWGGTRVEAEFTNEVVPELSFADKDFYLQPKVSNPVLETITVLSPSRFDKPEIINEPTTTLLPRNMVYPSLNNKPFNNDIKEISYPVLYSYSINSYGKKYMKK